MADQENTPRVATLVLCTADRVLGSLPPLTMPFPYWQRVDDVVGAARERFGFDAVVLRILTAEGRENGAGGAVAYLVEVDGDSGEGLPLTPWVGDDPLDDHPHRAAYARPGGPHADLRWARERLAASGRPVQAAAQQLRTWNLSSIWRLPTSGGDVWLKSQPGWALAEGRLVAELARIAAGAGLPCPVADVLASEGHRAVLDHVDGDDHYGAGPAVLAEALATLVRLQHHAAGHLDHLVALGVRDLRPEATRSVAAEVVDRHRPQLSREEQERLDHLLGSLPERYDAASAAGLPDTVVHGDFYGGNVRGRPGDLRLLDWAEAGVGHPVFDLVRMLSLADPRYGPTLTRAWVGAWHALRPGARPARAIAPLRPVAELYDAVVYQHFLDHIEPDEQRYHAADPLASLRAALRVAAGP